MKKIEAIIFDMDGVILDTESISKRAWYAAGKDLGIDTAEIEKIFRLSMGCNKNDTKIALENLYGSVFSVDEFLKKTSVYFDKIAGEHGIPLMNGAKQVLEYLSSRYCVALASSTRRSRVIPQLTDAGVIDFFKTVTTGDSVTHSKPAPDIYLSACASIGYSAGVCAAIEDSPNGIKSAYAAGLFCVMIPDQIEPDEEIKKLLWKLCESLDDLKSIF
ncbi:HAD family hydrolase [Treponema parvum]|uniref:HAD family hydrolase n=1 Tax=Treponema parvum TaxID=138851 RepID=UPI001AEC5A2D|nr:HAD family phosphatase [Treponema parvum]QTQ16222.1 HAD family phosphatase [Treponema parvum]